MFIHAPQTSGTLSRMWHQSAPYEWDEMIEQQTDALHRILVALLAMAWRIEAAGDRLPRHFHRAFHALLGPAEAAARQLSCAYDPVEAARLKRRFTILVCALHKLSERPSTLAARLIQLRAPQPIRRVARELRGALIDLRYLARLTETPNTS